MSNAAGKNNKQPGEEEDLPTASFSSSAPVMVHRTNRSIRSFDFLNMNDYSTDALAKWDNKE
jgi:hypothetical protein